LTTDSARRGRRLLLAAEHAFGLGRADLVEQLLTRASRTNLSRLERARMEWLREIFSDGMPGDAGRVLELCDIALESAGAGDADLSHSRTPIAAQLRRPLVHSGCQQRMGGGGSRVTLFLKLPPRDGP
jgi:hypothetical protein